MTTGFDYADTARRAESALTTTLDTWKNSVTTVTDQLRTLPNAGSLPRVEVTEVVERQFALIQQLVDLNHGYARKLAELADTFTGATRDQVESVTSAVRDQIRSVSDVARAGADTVERTVRDQVDQAEKAERQQAKEAHDEARESYRSLTKAELSEEAGKRDLPKSGTVEELVERLVADDTK